MWKLSIILTLCVFALCIGVSVATAIYVAHKEGKHLSKRNTEEKESVLFRLLFKFPFQLVTDAFNEQDYEFKENGFNIVTGEQGSGKTVTVVYLLRKYKQLYPNLKIRTNMAYRDEDGVIENWTNLVFSNNGVSGQIDVLDEVQNWFNSLESKDFPVEMMQEITQQRKQRKMILGTSQVWQRVAKPIREQVKYLYEPITLFGCLTIVFKYKPVINDEGGLDSKKLRQIFFFVHDAELRDSYDTYKKIQMMSMKGFKPALEQMHTHQAPIASESAQLPR